MASLTNILPTIEDLKGLNRNEIVQLLGHGYNDRYSAIWMYCLHRKRFFLSSYYLYLIFKNDEVVHVRYTHFRMDHSRKLDDYFKRFLTT
jgi:hypothetical protein